MKKPFHYFLFLLTIAIIFIGCSKNKIGISANEPINLNEGSQSVTFTNSKNLKIKAVLITPKADKSIPAVVVMHGCGGLWANDDPKAGKLENHFQEWADILQNEQIAVLFVDSYTPRNIVTFCDVAPPEDAVCSPAYERPLDAQAALTYLQSLPYINKDKIALMGFSHGASTTLASVVDYSFVQKDKWTVSNNGNTYDVTAPVDTKNGFATAIAYYPGCGFYSYFGSPLNVLNGKYRPYAPTLILAASEDPLYTGGATEILVQKAILGLLNPTDIELKVYQGAHHSFDEKSTGDDGKARDEARIKVLDWLDKYLK